MSWGHVKLRDLGTWYGGGTPSKSRPDYWEQGTIPWLSPKDMGADVLNTTQDRITADAVAGSTVKLVPANSIAVVVRSGILERTIPTALVPFETTLNQDMKALRPAEGVEPRWVAWGLRSMERSLLLGARKAGTTVASLEWPRYLDFTLPLPVLSEQRRIIDILEDHLSRLDAADTGLRGSLARTARLNRAITAASVWATSERVQIADVLSEGMRNGHSARASADGSGIRTLTITAVTKRDFSDANTKITTADPSRVGALWLTANDIFVQRANTPELVGSTAIYEGPDDWAIFPDLLIRLRIDAARALPQFVALAMQTEKAHRSLRSKAKGLAGSMPKIDQAAIGALEIPLPSLADQERIVSQSAESTTALSRLRIAVEATQARSAALRRALLTAAFSGKLTGAPSDSDRIEELATAT